MIDDAPLGHIKLARKLFDAEHGDSFWLEKRAFSRFEAWVDVIQLACFAPYRHVTKFGVVELARGEFIASRRHLAKRWRWSEKKVRVWLENAQKGARLRAQREAEAGTVYLVVNYDAYQSTPKAEGPAKGPALGPAGAQQGPKREAVKAIQAITTSPDVEAVCAHFVAVHPLRRPGDEARRTIRRVLATYSVAELCEAIDGNAADEWHRTRHKHEIDYVLRNNSNIDTFRAKAAASKAPAVDPTTGLLTPEGAARLRSA